MPVSEFYRRYLRYPIWRLRNPTAAYEQFYAHIVTQRLARRQEHSAIGATARPIRRSSELLDVMLKHGMRPQHRFIDYGCGSLRLGKALIEHLDANNFMGMDIAQEFLDLGAQFVGSELMQQKNPRLCLIDEAGLQAGRLFKADYIGSWHVCSKVPPSHLQRYLRNIIDLMDYGTQAFIQFPQTDDTMRLNHLNWTVPKNIFAETVWTISTAISIDFIEFIARNQAGVTETYAHLRKTSA